MFFFELINFINFIYFLITIHLQIIFNYLRVLCKRQECLSYLTSVLILILTQFSFVVNCYIRFQVIKSLLSLNFYSKKVFNLIWLYIYLCFLLIYLPTFMSIYICASFEAKTKKAILILRVKYYKKYLKAICNIQY